jgi:hypothetical protein
MEGWTMETDRPVIERLIADALAVGMTLDAFGSFLPAAGSPPHEPLLRRLSDRKTEVGEALQEAVRTLSELEKDGYEAWVAGTDKLRVMPAPPDDLRAALASMKPSLIAASRWMEAALVRSGMSWHEKARTVHELCCAARPAVPTAGE